jgi:arylsulfatase A-like enzyme
MALFNSLIMNKNLLKEILSDLHFEHNKQMSPSLPILKPIIYGCTCLLSSVISAASIKDSPNVLVIYLDDMGWAQPGCCGGKLAPTPNIDRLAASGVRFTQGYVSAAVSSPSRAGLMTGIYQGRFAHDFLNTPDLDLHQATMADRLHTLGYTTGIIGKWHLGAQPDHLPGSRGFDYAYGSVANLGQGGFYRGSQSCETPKEAPVTSPLYAREAIQFINGNNGKKPWFLYLSFNAVHVPHAASPEWMSRFINIQDLGTRKYAALIAEADDAIGQVLTTLKKQGITDKTLIFCISDNGGIAIQAEMGGLRGHKYLLWEGGIRVPFIVAWPGHLKGGRTLDNPVIQLDLMPTIISAIGSKVDPEWHLDGVNLMPLLLGETPLLDQRPMFWRYGPQLAVRLGNWKLVKASVEMEPVLVNLSEDLGEAHDLTAQNPAKAQELLTLWKIWNNEQPPQRMDVADGRSSGRDKAKGARDGD